MGDVQILDRNFRGWFVTVVKAQALNLAQFVDPEGRPCPSASSLRATDCAVLTTQNASSSNPRGPPYVVVQPLGKHGSGGSGGGASVWMMYSDTNLTHSLDSLFVGVVDTFVQHWPYTFADLQPVSSQHNLGGASEQQQQQVQPIVLHRSSKAQG